jgi:hypothetical protein
MLRMKPAPSRVLQSREPTQPWIRLCGCPLRMPEPAPMLWFDALKLPKAMKSRVQGRVLRLERHRLLRRRAQLGLVAPHAASVRMLIEVAPVGIAHDVETQVLGKAHAPQHQLAELAAAAEDLVGLGPVAGLLDGALETRLEIGGAPDVGVVVGVEHTS